MANNFNKRRYNPYLASKAKYHGFGDFLNVPFSKKLEDGSREMFVKPDSDLGKGLLIAAPAASMGVSSLLSNGFSTKAGNAISGIGSTIGGAVGMVNPLLGAAVSVGSSIIGGLTNAAFGHSVDEAGLARLRNYSNSMNNLVLDDSNNDALALLIGLLNFSGANLDASKYRNGWFNHKGTKALLADRATEVAATNRGLSTVSNAVNNADDTMDLNLLAHSAAFGGNLGTNGADFTNGLVFVNNGGSHELNLIGGVPMGVDLEGTPNLVEEGEVVFNDYVFSNRLRVPKSFRKKYKLGSGGPLTFSDAAKKLSKESEERPNDPISLNGLEALLGALMSVLENLREKTGTKYALGGDLANKFVIGGSFDLLDEARLAERLGYKNVSALLNRMNAILGKGKILLLTTYFPLTSGQSQYEESNINNLVQAIKDTYNTESSELSSNIVNTLKLLDTHLRELQGDALFKLLLDPVQLKVPDDASNSDYSNSVKAIMSSLGFKTDSDYSKALESARKELNYDVTELKAPEQLTQYLLNNIREDADPQNKELALALLNKLSPLVAHAVELGYRFVDAPVLDPNKVTFYLGEGGKWATNSLEDWKGSVDPAYLAIKNKTFKNEEDFRTAFRNTDSYINTTKYLKASKENRRAYLLSIRNESDDPEAKKYVDKFLDEKGNWKDGVDTSYENTIQPKREDTHPGSFWRSVEEANINKSSTNYIIGDNGIEEYYGDPKDLISSGSFTFDKGDGVRRTINYFKPKAGSTSKDLPKRYGYLVRNPKTAELETRWFEDNDKGTAQDQYNEFIRGKKGIAPQGPTIGSLGEEWVALLPENDKLPLNNVLRYAPALGSAIGLGLSLKEKPDESHADAVLEAARQSSGNYKPVTFNPIGDYLTYNPLDRDYYLNALNALSSATRRDIMNISGGNRGTALSGLLSADYNAINGTGDALMKMELANREQLLKVALFNLETNKFNSEGLFKADAANLGALASMQDLTLRGTMEAEKLRLNARLARENAISTNLTNLFHNLGEIGNDTVSLGLTNWNSKHGTYMVYGTDGKYYPVYGAPTTNPLKSATTSAFGGKLKKRKRGLTY